MKKILSLILTVSILISLFVPVSNASQVPLLTVSPDEAEYQEILIDDNYDSLSLGDHAGWTTTSADVTYGVAADTVPGGKVMKLNGRYKEDVITFKRDIPDRGEGVYEITYRCNFGKIQNTYYRSFGLYGYTDDGQGGKEAKLILFNYYPKKGADKGRFHYINPENKDILIPSAAVAQEYMPGIEEDEWIEFKYIVDTVENTATVSYKGENDPAHTRTDSFNILSVDGIDHLDIYLKFADKNEPYLFDDLVVKKINYKEIFVSPTGSDDAAGTIKNPLKTMDGARKLAATYPNVPVFVNFRGGEYKAAQTLFSAETDSRNAEAPLVFRAYNGETVTFKGSVTLDNSAFESVTDEDVLSRIPESAREHILRLDLSSYLDSPVRRIFYGNDKYGAKAGYKLLYTDGVMQQLARWPNTGYARISEVYESGTGGNVLKFHCGTADASRWSLATDAVTSGFMRYTWMHEQTWIDKIYPDVNIIEAKAGTTAYGAADNGRFVVSNLLEELDYPGEWFIDRGEEESVDEILYYYPLENFSDSKLELAVLSKSMVCINDCENITFEGLNFENTCVEAFEIIDSSNISIIDCNMKNIGRNAIVIEGGSNNLVQSCDISQISCAGIRVSGGNANTLTPCNHTIADNHIHSTGLISKGYAGAAVDIRGVGVRVSGNLIHSAPHVGIHFTGNDHRILYNEIHNVCYETSDMGAVYCSASFVERGTEIAHNYIHDIYSTMDTGRTYDVKAIYIDDMQSGINIHHNTIANTKLGITIAGGRDNCVENNIFVGVDYAIDLHVRGMEGIYQRSEVVEGGSTYQKAYDKLFTDGAYDTYKAHYSAIGDVFDSDGSLLADLGKPENNIIKENLIANSENIFLEPSYTFESPATNDTALQEDIKNAFTTYGTVENNIASDTVNFVSPQNQNYTVSAGDSILASIPGLKDTSTLNTGLYDASSREEDLTVTKADNLTLVSGGNLKENSFVLVWNKGFNADYYRVRVSMNPSMDDPVKNIVTKDNGILIEGLGSASDYYVTVQAYNDSRQNIGITMPKSERLEFSVGYLNPVNLFVAIKSEENTLEFAQRFDSDFAENREQTVAITVPDDAESTWRIETFLWDSDLKPLYIAPKD